jgi:hypothetical protein
MVVADDSTQARVIRRAPKRERMNNGVHGDELVLAEAATDTSRDAREAAFPSRQ